MLFFLHPWLQVLVALTAHRRTEAQWLDLLDRVYWLEDTHRNMASTDGYLLQLYTIHNAQLNIQCTTHNSQCTTDLQGVQAADGSPRQGLAGLPTEPPD